MPQKQPLNTKLKLHPRSQHRERYDFDTLIKSLPELADFVSPNKYGEDTVDFFNPKAVRLLNKALLKQHYGLDYWNIPKDYLCPPIPGRADYIHYIADILQTSASAYGRSKIPKGETITGLDIGVGTSCIYPIIGNYEYGWSFIGSDIDDVAIASAKHIIGKNPKLEGVIKIRRQTQPNLIFKGILQPSEFVDFTICNPPFHASKEEAQKTSLRKLKNLKSKAKVKPILNFGGQHNELWTKGGEIRFVKNMIYESRHFGKQCFWFTSLISKQSNLRPMQNILKKVNASEIKVTTMGQGQKVSRFVAWTFLSQQEQKDWVKQRW